MNMKIWFSEFTKSPVSMKSFCENVVAVNKYFQQFVALISNFGDSTRNDEIILLKISPLIVRSNKKKDVHPLSAKPTKWSNTSKQFVGNLPTNCLGVFVHFVGLALKGLKCENSLILSRPSW